jgi:predicted HicB family RNase H-like nuclease
MARKSSPEKKNMEAVASETKFVRLELPIEIHRKLRLQAAKEEVSMAQLAKLAVEEYLKRKGAAK